MFIIERANFIEEIKEERLLKESMQSLIQQRLKIVTEQKSRLKKAIKKIIINEMDTVPHRSTGINVLEDLLKKIVPVLEDSYKQLTTDESQRESFRAHIVNAIQNALAPTRVSVDGGEEETDDGGILNIDENALFEALKEADVDVEVGDSEAAKIDSDAENEDAFIGDNPPENINTEVQPGEEEKFIDIDGDGKEDLAPDEFTISGEEETGRNFAAEAFEKVEKQIVDAYKKLANESDRETFYDYLLTNIRLYFDKFEDELQTSLPEPTSEQYESEKNKLEQTDQNQNAF